MLFGSGQKRQSPDVESYTIFAGLDAIAARGSSLDPLGGFAMPKDPRLDSKVIELHAKLKELEHDKLVEEIRTVNNDDILGWVRYHFLSQNEMERPWQPMVINRYLERDKFFHNILPQWVAAVLSVFSLVVAILALILSLNPPRP